MDEVPDQDVQRLLAVAALMPVKKETEEKDENGEMASGVVEPTNEADVNQPQQGWWDVDEQSGQWWPWDQEEVKEEENWWDDMEEVKEEGHDTAASSANDDNATAQETYTNPDAASHDRTMHGYENQSYGDQGYSNQNHGKGYASRAHDGHQNTDVQQDAKPEERRVPWRPKGKGYGWSHYDRTKGYQKGKVKSKRYPPWAFRKRQMEHGKASMKGKYDQHGGHYTEHGYTDPWGNDWECLGLKECCGLRNGTCVYQLGFAVDTRHFQLCDTGIS